MFESRAAVVVMRTGDVAELQPMLPLLLAQERFSAKILGTAPSLFSLPFPSHSPLPSLPLEIGSHKYS